MSKVIVERPRRDHSDGWSRPGRTRVILDDDGEPLRAREPVRARSKTKALNENLAPLRRYLASQVNRPWNKVFSEISEHLKPSSTVQQHVRDHLEDFVAVRTRMRAGKVMVLHLHGGERALEDSYRQFYVHPRTGLLRRNPHYRSWSSKNAAARRAAAAERAARMREIGPFEQLHLLDDGVWWAVTLAPAERRFALSGPAAHDPMQDDVVFAAGLSHRTSADLYGRDRVRAVAKRVLSHAEKKRHGLI